MFVKSNSTLNIHKQYLILFGVGLYCDLSAVAEVVKNSLNMTVWGYVHTLPSATSHCSNVDEYR